MNKTMGVSPITDTIFYGTVKDDMWVGNREDLTDMAIKAVFEWFMHKHKAECPDGAYQIRFPSVPYVLEMRKENERLTLKSVNGDVWLLDSEGKPYLLSVDGDDYNNALNRLADFEAIGTIEEFKALKEKNVAKKPRIIHSEVYNSIIHYYCPNCGRRLGERGEHNVILFKKELYCQGQDCGQKLDWSE